MPSIDTAKVKSIAGEMIRINNQCRDDFSAVEQVVKRLKADWQQPQSIASSAFACFDEIKSKYFEAATKDRQELAQYLCDAVGIGYEEIETTNKSLLEGLFDGNTLQTAAAIVAGVADSNFGISPDEPSDNRITINDVWNELKRNISGIPNEIKNISEFLETIEGHYDELPDSVKEMIESLVPKDIAEAYKHTSDLLTGNFTMDNVYQMINYMGQGSSKSAAIVQTIKYSVSKGKERDKKAMQDITDQILEGDLYGATFDMVEGFVDVVGGGVIDVGFNLVGNTADALVDKASPNLNKAVTELTGKSVGEWISDTGEDLSDGLDKVTDHISNGVNYVTDSIDKVRSALCDLIF